MISSIVFIYKPTSLVTITYERYDGPQVDDWEHELSLAFWDDILHVQLIAYIIRDRSYLSIYLVTFAADLIDENP